MFRELVPATHPIGHGESSTGDEEAKWHIARHFADFKTQVEIT
jgi:hypothetical protein